MKGFIKIIDTSDNEHYINISYIIKFEPAEQEGIYGKTAISIRGYKIPYTIATKTTPEEIVDMIDLARS